MTAIIEEKNETVLALIDKALITTTSRTLVSSSEFEDILLDIRQLLTAGVASTN